MSYQHEPPICASSSVPDNNLEQFLDEVRTLIDSYCGQLIPDSFGSSDLSSRALKSEISHNGCFPSTVEQFPGLNQPTQRNSKKFTQLEHDLNYFRQRMKCHLEEERFRSYGTITKSRLECMQQIVSIFLAHADQVSEMFFSFIALYAMASTSQQPYQEFYLTISIGGDSVPPGYVEAYCLQPLSILVQLNHLYEKGKVQYLPKLVLIFSHSCQVVENNRDKAGNTIIPNLHKYNSRVTLYRIYEFVRKFFPEILRDCVFAEFPSYKRYSLARLFFAISWQKIPASSHVLEHLFGIKGSVVDPVQESQDLLKTLLGEYNAYVSRHMFTNLKLCHAHTLRFGSDRTEPQFHLVVSSLYPVLREEGEKIIEDILKAASQLKPMLDCEDDSLGKIFDTNNINFELALRKQVSLLPPLDKIHCQVGMKGMHAAYYKHPEESSLQEIVTERKHSAERLRQVGRVNKAKKLEKAFAQVTEIIEYDEYLNFLQSWCHRYLYRNASETEIVQRLAAQREAVEEVVVEPYEVRLLLNYWLL